MANEENMMNDIHELRRQGMRKQADLMFAVYYEVFMQMEVNKEKTIKAMRKAKKECPDFPFDFEGYGINLEETKA